MAQWDYETIASICKYSAEHSIDAFIHSSNIHMVNNCTDGLVQV